MVRYGISKLAIMKYEVTSKTESVVHFKSFVGADLHLMGNIVMTLLGSRVYENKVMTIYRWTDGHPKLKHWYLGYGFGVSGVF